MHNCFKNMAFKIYTKTGDTGQTSLFGGTRLPKHHLRIEAYGTTDELNAHLGLVRDLCPNADYRAVLKGIQDKIFTIGSNLAMSPDKNLSVPDVTEADIELLEKEIDKADEILPPLKHFILPGGHPAVSQCHVARCVCRRAERLTVALAEGEKVAPILIKYLNRLSDYLFTLCRLLSSELGTEEVKWKGGM